MAGGGDRVPMQVCKGINGLDKLVLQEARGSSAEFSNHGSMDPHGFARNRIWSIENDPPPFPTNSSNRAFIDLILRPTEEDMKIWPHSLNRERFKVGLISKLSLKIDKIYLSTTKIAILDHEKKRTFVLRKDGLPDAVVWNPWDKKAKAIADFGDDEYKHMLCVEAAAVEKPITLKPGEEWRGRLELSAVPSSFCSGQLDLLDQVVQCT
ncbi:hypothetical protein K2173_017429 [Erythroxylum novogranatense]|uniref:Glucose-6-phosphate 1-epimerase n=1 Tax=Erythroxylum novogranatense TaxID=1862640 RepID=A0AAV8TN64_9ROSI|nr:hypothetical protein K2173_017429 [Erythroxylum novogranatense]